MKPDSANMTRSRFEARIVESRMVIPGPRMHERWDGNGYPDGLAGEEIPIGARIVAVCDAYDAIISDRCYQHARSQSEALAELRSNAGSQFDPAVVDALKRHLNKAERMQETAASAVH